MQMELQPDDQPVAYKITRVDPDAVVIDQTPQKQALLLTRQAYNPVPIATIGDLSTSLLDTWITEIEPELIVIGTGTTHQLLDPTLAEHCYQQQIGFECMSTPSACRTHSILMAEHRHFAMLLLPLLS